jgi:rhamnogalacturonyl hydrolase YesR
MRRRDFVKGAAVGASLPVLGISANAQSLSGTEELPVVEKVRRALLAFQRRDWEQGVTAHAFIDRGETEMAVLLARSAVVCQHEDGRLGLVGPGNPHSQADACVNGEAVLFAYRHTQDDLFGQAHKKMLEYMLQKVHKNSDGVYYHLTGQNTIWSDSTYMFPPYMAYAGYPEEALKQLTGLRRILADPKTGLLRHIWDDDKKEFKRAAAWGGGNGWYAAGLARTIQHLGESQGKIREELAGQLQTHLENCLKWMRPDGLFHDVIDDPNSFVETNLGQMLAYAIYRGVHLGVVEKTYLEKAEKMREAALAKVDRWGFVRDAAGAPKFDRPGISPEAQAFTLLMEAARGAVTR